MAQIINYSCDGQGNGNCSGEHSEVRVLPFSNGNLIICRNHFEKEMEFRKRENLHQFGNSGGYTSEWIDDETLKRKKDPSAYDLPTWNSLKVYTGE